MPTGMTIVKGHAYGNDFLLVPEAQVEGDLPALARAMCSRHEGIGADGLMAYAFGSSAIRTAPFQCRRKPVRSCGNGIRCLAALACTRTSGHLARHNRDTRRTESARTAESEQRCADVSRVDGDATGPAHRNRGGRRKGAGCHTARRESPVRAAGRPAPRVAPPQTGSRHRTPSEIPRAHERVVCQSRNAQSRAGSRYGSAASVRPRLRAREHAAPQWRRPHTAARRATWKWSRRAAASASNGATMDCS